MVYWLELIYVVIWNSAFKMAAVILPPKETAPLNVTKSPACAPWATSVTVMIGEPLVAAKVASPAVVVERNGVTSYTKPFGPFWM